MSGFFARGVYALIAVGLTTLLERSPKTAFAFYGVLIVSKS